MNLKERLIMLIGIVIIIMIIIIAIQFESESLNKCIASGHTIEFCESIQ